MRSPRRAATIARSVLQQCPAVPRQQLQHVAPARVKQKKVIKIA